MSLYAKFFIGFSLLAWMILFVNFYFIQNGGSCKEIEISLPPERAASKDDIFEYINVKNLNSEYFLIGIDGNVKLVATPPYISDQKQDTKKQEILELFDFFHENSLFIIDTDILEALYHSWKDIVNDDMGVVDFNRMEEFNTRKIDLKKINSFYNASASSVKQHINFGILMSNVKSFYLVSSISLVSVYSASKCMYHKQKQK